MIDVKEMTPEQKARFGEVVDSRVRLLGEPYDVAFEKVQADGASNEEWILNG